MDPYSGEIYKDNEIEFLNEKIKSRLVRVEGKPKHIRRLSKSVKQYNKVKKRKKISKSSRKKNR